jgi:hypothetical protein
MNEPLHTYHQAPFWSRPRIVAVVGSLLFLAGAAMPVTVRVASGKGLFRYMTFVDPYAVGIGIAMVALSLLWLRGLAWCAIAVDIGLGWLVYRCISDPGWLQLARPAWALLIVGTAVMIVASRWSLLEPHRSLWQLLQVKLSEFRKLRSSAS